MSATPTFIIIASSAGAEQLQGWLNTINAQPVITEAVTVTDSTGIEKLTLSNPGTVQEVSVEDLLQTLIREVRALRKAAVFMAVDGGRAEESDFDPNNPEFDSIRV
jgi:hypothetical protein